MDIENKDIITYKNGQTKDIINECIDTYNNYYMTCFDFAQQFRESSVLSTCKNIYNYVLKTVNYKIDPEGLQLIKTPPCLLDDKEGDCKSYTIFICSCLRCLGIDCYMRFVSYSKRGDYTHVYAVALDEYGKEIKIDPVAKVQGNIEFGNEIEYTKKIDMGGTEIHRLSGIGNTEEISLSQVINNNTKVNINYLKSLMNVEEALLLVGKGTQDNVNMLNLYNIIIKIIEQFGSATNLQTSGYVLAHCIQEGDFSVSFDSQDDIAPYYSDLAYKILNEISQYVNSSVDNEKFILSAEFERLSADFISWWNSKILASNYTSELANYDKQIAEGLEEGSTFFLYTVVAENLLSNTAKEKAIGQHSILSEFISTSGINLDIALNIIRSSITIQTGETPEEVVQVFAKENGISIGDFSSVLDSITNAISKGADAFSTVWDSVKGGGSSNNNVYPYRPDTSDYSGFSNNTLLYVAGGGLILALILSSRNKNKKGKR